MFHLDMTFTVDWAFKRSSRNKLSPPFSTQLTHWSKLYNAMSIVVGEDVDGDRTLWPYFSAIARIDEVNSE